MKGLEKEDLTLISEIVSAIYQLKDGMAFCCIDASRIHTLIDQGCPFVEGGSCPLLDKGLIVIPAV